MPLPRIGLTIGDPSGIGPEIAEKAASDSRVLAVCEPVLYGPSGSERRGYHPGVGVAEGGRVSFEAVKAATLDAMEGRLDAISTAPINKAVWAAAGLSWRGHTDLLASLTGAPHVAMMFRLCSLESGSVGRLNSQRRSCRALVSRHRDLRWLG